MDLGITKNEYLGCCTMIEKKRVLLVLTICCLGSMLLLSTQIQQTYRLHIGPADDSDSSVVTSESIPTKKDLGKTFNNMLNSAMRITKQKVDENLKNNIDKHKNDHIDQHEINPIGETLTTKIEENSNDYEDQRSKTTPGYEDIFPDVGHDWFLDNRTLRAMYVLSAIAVDNLPGAKNKHSIKVTGWVDKQVKSKPIKCCYVHKNGQITEFEQPQKSARQRSNQIATQVACPYNRPLTELKGVTIQFLNQKCPWNESIQYIKLYKAKQPELKPSFAICLKIVYGQHVNNAMLTEWFEYYKLLGVDKIFTFTYDLGVDTINVIRNYSRSGFVESRPFDYPGKNHRKVGAKSVNVWEDERVVIFDCLQRASMYTYMAIFDMDEFLVPLKHDNVKDLMGDLLKSKPNAAGFTFGSYIFDKNSKKNIITSDKMSTLEKYTWRTDLKKGRLSRNKYTILPSRVTTHLTYTHKFSAQKGYTHVNYVDGTIAGLNHYRACYKNFLRDCKAENVIKDTRILKLLNKLRQRT